MVSPIGISTPDVAVESVPKVLSVERAEEVSIALADPINLALLAVTFHKERSVRQIAHQLDIAQASCYRRLRRLVALQLVEQVSRQVSPHGRRSWGYRSRVDVLRVTFEGDAFVFEIDISPSIDDVHEPKQFLRVVRRWAPSPRRR